WKVTAGESGVRICFGYVWLGGLSEKNGDNVILVPVTRMWILGGGTFFVYYLHCFALLFYVPLADFNEVHGLPEVRESESKARSQAEMLKNAYDEHGLELRVRAANEAEAACEQRLSAAEAEIEELKAQLDKTESSMFVVFYLGAKFLVMRSER
ncbi:E3 ubiquitin-protein ligase BRE1-like protein, partial [Trifolium medium]|nr:E3 ubiquitin-protein ligase BRE1-like protein [Trifolium medium]